MALFTLTIGIPALNEGANIQYLLRALLSQLAGNYMLERVVVISDGSTDNTAPLARAIDDDRIQVIDHIDRKGQAARQDEIIHDCTSDLLLLMNADMLPQGEDFLQRLVAPFYADKTIGLVSCQGVPLPAETRFEKIINFGVSFKETLVGNFQGGDNVYNCHGHTRIFSKAFLNNLQFGGVVSEDAYSYFDCKRKGFNFRYIPEARVAYRSPQSLRDHLKQSVRFIQGKEQLGSIFGKKQVKEAHALPLGRVLLISLQFFCSHPLLYVKYFGVTVVAAVASLFKQHAVLTWDSATSSKTLIKPK